MSMAGVPVSGGIIRMEIALDANFLGWFPATPEGRDFSDLKPSYFYAAHDGESYIPFKYFHPEHAVALKYHALAQRGRKAGDAHSILYVEMHMDAFLEALFDGSVKVFPDRQSIGFMKCLNMEHYPSLAQKKLILSIHELAA
jgi:hypothetical protein